jgi:hypothetical protein
MSSLARARRIVLVGLLPAGLVASQPVHADIVPTTIDLSAFVHEALLPGGTIFEDTDEVTAAGTTPLQSVELLHLASKGENLSGRSTNITGAFASALAQSDGSGGVGVTAFIGGSPSNTNPAAISQLVSEATWEQSFTNTGTNPLSITMHLHIPALQVGLIGVPPERDSISATETAEAEATLAVTIVHPDSSTSPGRNFEFGLRTFERQLILSPGVFENFADVGFLGLNSSTVSLFDSFKDNADPFNPRFTIDAVSPNVSLGILEPGDTMSYIYQLTAEGTTHGGEQGYVAFLGDPFGADVVGDNLVLIATPVSANSVSEPDAWALSVVALGSIIGVLGRSSSRQRLEPSPPSFL